MVNSGQLIFSESMDSFFVLFINPEHSIAHLFDSSHVCWAGLLVVMKFIIAGASCCTSDKVSTRIFVIASWITLGCWEGILVVILYLFALKVMLKCFASGQDCRTVMMMTLLFTFTEVMLADVTSSQTSGTVMVMLLPFAVIPDSCTSNKGST
jgi:hypothetical protein